MLINHVTQKEKGNLTIQCHVYQMRRSISNPVLNAQSPIFAKPNAPEKHIKVRH